MNDIKKYMDLINAIENDNDTPDMSTGDPTSGYIGEKSGMLVEALKNDLAQVLEGEFRLFNNAIDYQIRDAKAIDEVKGVNKYSLLKTITESLGGFVKLSDHHFSGDDLIGTIVIDENEFAPNSYSRVEIEAMYEKLNSEQWKSRLQQMGFGEFTKENFINVMENFTLKNIQNGVLHRLKESSILDLIANNHLTIDNLSKFSFPVIFEGQDESWMFSGAVTENVMSLLEKERLGIILQWDGDQNVIVSK